MTQCREAEFLWLIYHQSPLAWLVILSSLLIFAYTRNTLSQLNVSPSRAPGLHSKPDLHSSLRGWHHHRVTESGKTVSWTVPLSAHASCQLLSLAYVSDADFPTC